MKNFVNLLTITAIITALLCDPFIAYALTPDRQQEIDAAAAAAAANQSVYTGSVGSPFTTTGNTYVPTGSAYNPSNPYQVNSATNINNPYNPNNPALNPTVVNQQIQNSILTSTSSTSTAQTGSAVTQGATGIASCLGSQILAKAMVGAANDAIGNTIGKVTDMALNVPTAESGSTGANIRMETNARVGGNISLFGYGIPAFPSWDAMAYCIVNTMIIYIADSTIQWINTGFEGNPAFLNNPDQFFQDLANQEKVAFLQGLAYGVNSSICGVFKNSVVSAILSRYGKNQQNMYGQQGYQNGGYGYGQNGAISACPYDQTPGKLNAFMNGGFNEGGGWDTWFQVTQNPMSNPYDTYFNATDRMNKQVEAIQVSQNRELTWNNGYLSFRKCENGEKDKSKCSITTPGTVIQNQLNSTLNLGKNRLVLAEKFDQVVTAVVDQLITTALDKALDRESYSSSQETNPYSNSNLYNNQYNATGTPTYYNQPQYIPPTQYPTTTTSVDQTQYLNARPGDCVKRDMTGGCAVYRSNTPVCPYVDSRGICTNI